MQWTHRHGTAAIPPAAAIAVELALTGVELRRARRWLLATGILALLGGAAAILVPAVASVATAIFIGWMLVFAAVTMLIDAFAVRRRSRMAVRLASAALAAIAGIWLIAFPTDGTVTLTVLLAGWFLGTGAVLLFEAARRRGEPGAGLLAVNGVLSLALGLLVALDLPSSAAWALGLLVGVNLIFWGVRALVAAHLLKRALEG